MSIMPKKNNTPASSQSNETTLSENKPEKVNPKSSTENNTKEELTLSIPEFNLNLTQGQQINIEYFEYESINIKGAHTLDSNLFEIPLTVENEALIKSGYELDESKTPEPVFQTILNTVERQTYTRFFLKRKTIETYILAYGEYKDLDEDIKYGWYLVSTPEAKEVFVRPLTKDFILQYLIK